MAVIYVRYHKDPYRNKHTWVATLYKDTKCISSGECCWSDLYRYENPKMYVRFNRSGQVTATQKTIEAHIDWLQNEGKDTSTEHKILLKLRELNGEGIKDFGIECLNLPGENYIP